MKRFNIEAKDCKHLQNKYLTKDSSLETIKNYEHSTETKHEQFHQKKGRTSENDREYLPMAKKHFKKWSTSFAIRENKI